MRLNFTPLLFSFFCVLTFGALGQSSKVNLTDFNFQTGAMHYYSDYIFSNELQLLNPNSTILDRNLSDYSNQSSDWINSGVFTSFSAGFTIDTYPSIGFRIGVAGWRQIIFESRYVNTNEARYDTLVSVLTGGQVYIDSTHVQEINGKVTGDFFSLDLLFEYKTLTVGRFDFRTGIGVRPGIAYNIKSEIIEVEQTTTNEEYDYLYSGFGNPNAFDNRNDELFRNKSRFNIGFYVPVNLGWRLGKKENVWSQLAINAEVTPTFLFLPFQNGSKLQQFSISEKLGLRYYFN